MSPGAAAVEVPIQTMRSQANGRMAVRQITGRYGELKPGTVQS